MEFANSIPLFVDTDRVIRSTESENSSFFTVGTLWRSLQMGRGLLERVVVKGERGHTMFAVVSRALTPTKRGDVWGPGTAYACYFVGSIKCS